MSGLYALGLVVKRIHSVMDYFIYTAKPPRFWKFEPEIKKLENSIERNKVRT